ncbi:MAG: GatB/YqeY domain-containing protein [Deltaproteobacteria bacterium]|nr:GatB/YqeY domain-containing protein [Deltaproteobacteria bacterium]
MGIKGALGEALKESLKARDQVRLDTIRMAVAAIKNKEIDKRGELTEPEAVQVVATLVKQRRESIAEFSKGGRQDLVDKETRELGILLAFLPPSLPAEEVEGRVKKKIAELGAKDVKDMGRVMKALREELAGQVDGQLLSDTVRKLLAG